jgi:glutathione S-transferase
MIQLHYAPGNASMAPHLLLLELGLPFELRLVDREHNAHKAPEYLRLNPNGLIPVLVEGDLVLYETAAIVLHLVDTHPDAALAPPVGTPARAHFYKWLLWLAASLQPLAGLYFYPERWFGDDQQAARAQLSAQAEARTAALLEQVDAHLAAQQGPWFDGATYSALDPYVLMLCRWTRGMQRPARSFAHIGPYLQRMLQRPATQRMLAAEGLREPWV